MSKSSPKRPLQWVSIEKLAQPLSEEIAAFTAAIKRDLEKRYLSLRWQGPDQKPDIGNDNGLARHPGPAGPPDEMVRVEAMLGAAGTATTAQDAETERQELLRATAASSAEAAALRRKLDAIQQQIARLGEAHPGGALREIEATLRQTDPAPPRPGPRVWLERALRQGLVRTVGQVFATPQGWRNAAAVLALGLLVALAAVGVVSERSAEIAATSRVTESRLQELQAMHRAVHGEAAALGAELSMARREIAGLTSAVSAWQDKAARAERQLAGDRREVRAASEAERQELIRVARTASSDAAALRQELASARLKVADLSAATAASRSEAARLAAKLTAAQRTIVVRGAETAAGEPPGVARARLASLGNTAVARAADPALPHVTADELAARPAAYRDRDFVVSGSLTRLLWRYRLRSGTGGHSIVVDVDRLSGPDQQRLEAATQALGPLDSVRVRIAGRLKQGTLSTYSLLASELLLVE